MNLHLRRCITLTLVSLTGLLVASSTSSAATMSARLGGDVRRSTVKSSTSVFAWNQQTREVLISHNADRVVSPASTMKLLTSAATLAQFGPDHQFETSLLLNGAPHPTIPSRWIGDLYLVGGGDPSLSTAGFARENYGSVTSGTNIADLTRAVHAAGITTITGRIFVDDSRFDSQRYVAEWKPAFRYEETGALGALTVNQAQLGRWIGGTSTRLPDLHAGNTLRSLLQREGVRVIGASARGSAPETATKLGAVLSPKVHVLLQQMNRASDNFYAEILLKQIGYGAYGATGGTTAAGRRAGREQLARLGVDVRRLTWVDGSGLAYGNRLTARMLGQTLELGHRAPWGTTWTTSFARSGVTGTIRKRMTRAPYRNRVSAKTGTLRHVSALAGFADRYGSVDRYGFAVLTYHASGAQVSYTRARALQDRIAMTLVR